MRKGFPDTPVTNLQSHFNFSPPLRNHSDSGPPRASSLAAVLGLSISGRQSKNLADFNLGPRLRLGRSTVKFRF